MTWQVEVTILPFVSLSKFSKMKSIQILKSRRLIDMINHFRDIEKIRDGIAEKVSHFLFLIMGFLICVVMSFIYGWKLSLVVIAYVPIVVITNTVIGKVSNMN